MGLEHSSKTSKSGTTSRYQIPQRYYHNIMPKDSRRTKSRHHIQVLNTLNIEELLEVQKEVNALLEKRFIELKLAMKHKSNGNQRSGIRDNKKYLPTNLERNLQTAVKEEEEEPTALLHPVSVADMQMGIVENSEGSCMEDTQEYIFTQVEPPANTTSTKENTSKHNHRPKNVDTPVIKESQETILTQESYDGRDEKTQHLYSSPLKESQGSADSAEVIGIPLLEKNTNILARNSYEDWSRKKTRTRNDSSSEIADPSKPNKVIKTDRGLSFRSTSLREKQSIAKQKDFNNNPFTLKPWILEDFKPNQDIASVKRGQRKLDQFHKQVGMPMGTGGESNLPNNDDRIMDNFIFDNLVGRTDSPPGYGRLDFPTTQERASDKLESKRIIHQKTLHRFLSAVNRRIPPHEREFLFKRDALNDAIDNDNFRWDKDLLQIYPPA